MFSSDYRVQTSPPRHARKIADEQWIDDTTMLADFAPTGAFSTVREKAIL